MLHAERVSKPECGGDRCPQSHCGVYRRYRYSCTDNCDESPIHVCSLRVAACTACYTCLSRLWPPRVHGHVTCRQQSDRSTDKTLLWLRSTTTTVGPDGMRPVGPLVAVYQLQQGVLLARREVA